MQSRPAKGFSIVERGANAFPSSNFAGRPNNTVKEPIALSSSSASSSSESSSSEDTQEAQVAVYQNNGNTSNQLVLYDPSANGSSAIEPILPEPIKCQPSPRPRFLSSKVLPSVGAFTVQCANCFKWRLIPTKEKYEEIREHILENPFVCETASEWRPEISCNDPTDISQDGSRLWAIDKPNIAQPPSGWQRLLRIRGEGSTKFADIYYQAPTGKKLRSMVEVQKFLMEHPEYTREGVRLSQFSFQIPKPLQEDYVRKRPPRLTAPINNTKPLEPSEVNPLAWAAPGDAELQLGRPALPSSCSEIPASDHRHRPAKQAKRMPQKQAYTTEVRLERGHPRNND